jgi:hypothetical protein
MPDSRFSHYKLFQPPYQDLIFIDTRTFTAFIDMCGAGWLKRGGPYVPPEYSGRSVLLLEKICWLWYYAECRVFARISKKTIRRSKPVLRGMESAGRAA